MAALGYLKHHLPARSPAMYAQLLCAILSVGGINILLPEGSEVSETSALGETVPTGLGVKVAGEGDLILVEPSPHDSGESNYSDVVRFENTGAGGTGIATVFSSATPAVVNGKAGFLDAGNTFHQFFNGMPEANQATMTESTPGTSTFTDLNGNHDVTIWRPRAGDPGGSGVQNNPNIYNIESVSSVPEPASLVMLGSGILGLLGYAWRRGRLAAA